MLPVLPGVLLVPLIGVIDDDRAHQVIDSVLAGVAAQRARVVILDVSAVPVIDSEVANTLIQTAQATMLLGARVLLVGIRPEIAQSIVGLGLDLTHIATYPTLSVALATLQRSFLDVRPHAELPKMGAPMQPGGRWRGRR